MLVRKVSLLSLAGSWVKLHLTW